ncbi:hypothetical protein P2318_28905 [Myxococcaceae bacterium GXIMD 01537]
MRQMKGEGEVVYTMTDYYDGPMAGIANYEGRPHAYLRTTDVGAEDLHEDGDLYELWPVDEETLRLALEDWAIWERWEAAFYSGRTTSATHPALPEDRPRHLELEPELKLRLVPPDGGMARARGRFRASESAGQEPPGMGLKVWWTTVPGAP